MLLKAFSFFEIYYTLFFSKKTAKLNVGCCNTVD